MKFQLNFSHPITLLWAIGLLLACMGAGLFAADIAVGDAERFGQLVEQGDLEPLTTDSLTFVQLSDTHLGRNQWTNQPELTAQVLQEVAELYPDAAFVVFTGDNTDGNMQIFHQAIENAPLPVFWVPGNTDVSNFLSRGELLHQATVEDFTGPHRYHQTHDDPETGAWEIEEDGTGLFSFQSGPNFFLFVDSSFHAHEGAIRPDRMRWIHRTLSRHSGMNVFLFTHHGMDLEMNEAQLDALLRFHSPRFRSLNHVFGHGHSNPLPLEKDGVNHIETADLQGGTYRVFHIRDDHFLTYVRWSTAYAETAAAEEESEQADPPRVLDGTGVSIIRAAPRSAPSGPVPEGLDGWENFLDWRANDDPAPGDILALEFQPMEGWIFRDQSGSQNDLYSNARYLRHPSDPGLIVEKDGVYGKHFGVVGSRNLVGFDTWSLASPHRTNRITLEAGIYLPEQPIGREFLILDKTAYALGLDAEGRAFLSLWLGKDDQEQREVRLATPGPLEAGTWQRLAGTFDGTAVRLFVDDREVAREEAEEGEFLLASNEGSLRVGAPVRRERATDSDQGFLISDIRIANIDKDASTMLRERVVPAFRAAGPPSLDGVLNKDEWPDEPAFLLEKEASEGIVHPALEGIRAKGYFQWDEECLYLAVVVDDEVHHQPYAESFLHRGDMIQIQIENGDGRFDVGFAMTDDGAPIMTRWGFPWGEPSAIDFAVGREGQTTTYEIALPRSVLPPREGSLQQGVGWNFAFRVWNNDGRGSETHLEYAPSQELTLVD